MKMTPFFTVISFFLFFLIQLSKGQYLTEQQKTGIEKQVDSVFHTLVKAAENLDYDKISTGVDDRYCAGFITNGKYYASYDSLIAGMKTGLQTGTKQSITIRDEKITVLSDSIVLLNAVGDAKIEFPAGQSFMVKFLWSFVYKKIDNNWNVIQSHQSSTR